MGEIRVFLQLQSVHTFSTSCFKIRIPSVEIPSKLNNLESFVLFNTVYEISLTLLGQWLYSVPSC